jgi:hypothetical protein
VKNDNYQPWATIWPVSQIDIQRNMVGFVMDGHILLPHKATTIVIVKYYDFSPTTNLILISVNISGRMVCSVCSN